MRGLLAVIIFLAGVLAHAQTYKIEGPKEGPLVCTATLNSKDEREIFKKKLMPQGFRFVELVPETQNPDLGNRSGWFDDACKQNFKCDILVVSAHFANRFYGNKDYEITPNKMEDHACNNSCDGILKSPQEVFLFGCNTVADKGKEHRTREEYLASQIAQGSTRVQAEIATELRFGQYSDSYKASMQRAFKGVPNIYGFDDKAPYGAVMSPKLAKYFSENTDYKNHLTQITGRRAGGLIEATNKSLASALANTPLRQCAGIQEKDDSYKHLKNICDLYMHGLSDKEKLSRARHMLASEDVGIYRLAVTDYIKKLKAEGTLQNYSKEISEIASDPVIQAALDKFEKDFEGSAILKNDVIELQTNLGRYDIETMRAKKRLALRKNFQRLDKDDIDAICLSRKDALKITAEDVDLDVLKIGHGYELANCVGVKDEKVTKAILDGVNYIGLRELHVDADRLVEMPGHDKEKIEFILRVLNTSYSHKKEAALAAYIQILPREERQAEFDKYKSMIVPPMPWYLADQIKKLGLKL